MTIQLRITQLRNESQAQTFWRNNIFIFGKLSIRQTVRSAKCPFGKMSVRQNVRSAKWPSAKCPFGKMSSVRQSVFRQSVFRQNVRVPIHNNDSYRIWNIRYHIHIFKRFKLHPRDLLKRKSLFVNQCHSTTSGFPGNVLKDIIQRNTISNYIFILTVLIQPRFS
jgi:hypothetical protein